MSRIQLKRHLRTLSQSPKTSFLCACKKVEMGVMGKHASAHAYNKPLGMDIELTNICNLQCPWCDTQFYADKSIKKREIPWDVFQQIVPKLEGINRVLFCGGGETLTYKHATEAIELTKQYVPNVILHSNGVLLRGKRAEKLSRSGLDELRISIDGSDEETFQEIRGTSLSAILDNMKEFSKLSDTPIMTISVISQKNWRSLLDTPDMLREVDNVRTLCFQPVEVDFLGWETDEYYPTREQWTELQGTIADKCQRYGLETNIADQQFDPLFIKPFKICEYPFFGYITLNFEGCMAPCCRLTNVAHMGDLKTQSFDEIWNGHAFEQLRSMMIKGDYPSYCHDRCNYRIEMNPEVASETPGRLRYNPVRSQETSAPPLLQIE